MKSRHDPPHMTQRLLKHLGNQSAPPSLYGIGRKVLYRCPSCDHPWLMDGRNPKLRLSDEAFNALVEELHAEKEQLPLALCRLCALSHGRGILEIDEYAHGKGYGLNWEATSPVGAHLQAAICSLTWMEGQPELVPDVVRHPDRARTVLEWFSQVKTFPVVHLLSYEESREMARGNNLAGHQMTGTQGWQWKGAIFRQFCPPLHDDAMIALNIALPPDELLRLKPLIAAWQLLAAEAAPLPMIGE